MFGVWHLTVQADIECIQSFDDKLKTEDKVSRHIH